jgi:hypothetical protein
MVFVFGSNLAGVHGAGAARYAMQHEGAVWKEGIGYYGNSYALPTKDHNIETLPLQQIKYFVSEFIKFANDHPELQFKVTRIGCGLAGFTDEQIAPMFKGAPANCLFDDAWIPYLTGLRFKYWGTM